MRVLVGLTGRRFQEAAVGSGKMRQGGREASRMHIIKQAADVGDWGLVRTTLRHDLLSLRFPKWNQGAGELGY